MHRVLHQGDFVATTAESIALEALTRSMLNPTPCAMFGTKAKPGVFTSSGKGQKEAAILLETRGLVEKTDIVEAKGKPLYRISAQGVTYALENAEPVQLMREIRDGLHQLILMRDRVNGALNGMEQQKKVLEVALQRITSPPVQQQPAGNGSTGVRSEWIDAAVEFVKAFERQNPNQFCPLPEIFNNVAKPAGASLGIFQDGMRRLADDGKLRLHPFTRPLYTIVGEECALVAGQEIKYYAQFTAG